MNKMIWKEITLQTYLWMLSASLGKKNKLKTPVHVSEHSEESLQKL